MLFYRYRVHSRLHGDEKKVTLTPFQTLDILFELLWLIGEKRPTKDKLNRSRRPKRLGRGVVLSPFCFSMERDEQEGL